MQFSLFYDYSAIIDSCSFLKKYDAIFQAFDIVYEQRDFPAFGRRGYPRSAYLKALIYKQSENIKFISEIEEFFHRSGNLLVDNKIATLDVIIADSKPIKANTKHNNPKNPNRKFDKSLKIKRNPMASLSYYSYLKQPFGEKKKDFSWFWGHRTHVLLSREGIPLIEVTLPNMHTDGKTAKGLLKKLTRVYGQKKDRIFIGDAGYDDRELYDFIVEKLKSEPFIPLNYRNKHPDKTFGPNGLPLCEAGLEMKFTGIAREPHRTRKQFRCPIASATKKERSNVPDSCPVDHHKLLSGNHFGCTAYIDITDDNRSRVPRESKRYKDIYKLRTEAERYFSRLGPCEVEEVSQFKYCCPQPDDDRASDAESDGCRCRIYP